MSARGLARGGALMLAATVLGNAALLMLDGWANGLLGTEGYGAFGAIKRVLQLAGFVALVGMENTTVRYVARASGPEEAVAVRSRAAWVAGLGGLVVAALLVAGARTLAGGLGGGEDAVHAVRLGALAVPFGALRMVAVAAAQGQGRMGVRAGVMFVAWPLAQALGLAWIARGGPDLRGAVAVYVGAMALGAALAWGALLRGELRGGGVTGGAEPPLSHEPTTRSMLAFAWPGWLQGVGMAAYTWVDHVLLAGLRSAQAAGVYGPVATLAPLFGLGLQALGGPLAPRIAERHAAGDVAGMQAAYRSVTRWALLIALPPVAVCVVAPEAVLGCWPNGSLEAVTALRLTAIAQLLCTGVGSVNVLLLMAGRPRAALANAIPALVLNVALSWWLIPRWGVTGAALANAGAMLAANGMALAQVWTALRVHPADGGMARALFAGGIGALGVLGVRALGLGPLGTTAGACLAAGAGVLGAYALVGATDEDRALARGAWARVRGRGSAA